MELISIKKLRTISTQELLTPRRTFNSFIFIPFLEIISLCWIFGIVIGFLPLFGWHKEVTEGCLFVEIMDYNYLVFLYFTTIITPALILAIFYGLIYKVILKQVNNMRYIELKETIIY